MCITYCPILFAWTDFDLKSLKNVASNNFKILLTKIYTEKGGKN